MKFRTAAQPTSTPEHLWPADLRGQPVRLGVVDTGLRVVTAESDSIVDWHQMIDVRVCADAFSYVGDAETKYYRFLDPAHSAQFLAATYALVSATGRAS